MCGEAWVFANESMQAMSTSRNSSTNLLDFRERFATAATQASTFFQAMVELGYQQILVVLAEAAYSDIGTPSA